MKIVYILTNEAMPDLIKIGRTSDLKQRLKQLNSATEIPLPFECVYAAEVNDEIFVEAQLHKGLAPRRINPKREFFEMDPIHAIELLKLAAIREVTLTEEEIDKEDAETIEKVRGQRPPTNLYFLGLKPGDQLNYYNDVQIICKVHNDRQVVFDGKITSLTALTQKLKNTDRSIAGTIWWTIGGETVYDRRKRMEKEGTYGQAAFKWDDKATRWDEAVFDSGAVEKT